MYANEKWMIKGRVCDAGALACRIGISEQLACLVIGRLQSVISGYGKGIPVEALADAVLDYLAPDKTLMHDASLMKDMDKALAVLEKAAAMQKKTLVIGDYDVDGIMGALILCTVLKKAIAGVDHYIPHRVDDGYGINEKIVEAAARDGVELIVTCDNGVSAHESIKMARALGIDVIITDHHEIPEENSCKEAEGVGMPQASAVVNPKRGDCGYPFKDLCGAAVAYKLATEFAKRARIALTGEEQDELFCFMAVATICDIVELTGENRRIVYHGLKRLNSGIRNPGMAELIRINGLAGRELSTFEVGHIIGPCINAAGRLDTAELSYGLFTETVPARLEQIAGEILELNRTRQELTNDAFEAAVGEIERGRMSGENVIVLYMPSVHESICGIVAGKIKDRYYRPTIVFTDSPSGFLKGSGRSVDGISLLERVNKARGLLEKAGGHKMAVGITMDKRNLAAFREIMNSGCDDMAEMFVPIERIDLCIEPSGINAALLIDIDRLKPFGRGNEKPVFAVKDLALEFASVVGSKKNVIKMKLRSGRANGARGGYNGCGGGGGSGGNGGGSGGGSGGNGGGGGSGGNGGGSGGGSGGNGCCAGGYNGYGGSGAVFDAVFFGDICNFFYALDLAPDKDGLLVNKNMPPVRVDLTFLPEINEYNGVRRMQLIVRSIRKAAVMGS